MYIYIYIYIYKESNCTTMEEFLRVVANLNVTLDKDFREIVLALTQELLFDVIKDMIHNGNPDEGFLKDQEWAKVIETCLEFDCFDVFEMLLNEGVRPDVVIPGEFIPSPQDDHLLQVAVKTGQYEEVHHLLMKDVNVNKALDHHSHRFDEYSPKHCRSIMCPVFRKDDPEMMKLLLQVYDQSCNWDGKCTLSMACHMGAVKCALSLLKDPEYDKHVNLAHVRLHHIPFNKTTLLPILYDMGVKKGIYTSDDLGVCLHAAANCKITIRGSAVYMASIAGYIEMLLSLGAPVNFEVNGKTPLDILLHPILVFDTGRACFGTFAKALSLLLHHGARAQLKFVNCFIFSLFITVIFIHRTEHPSLSGGVLAFFFEMISLFRKDEFSKQILGSESPSPSGKPKWFEKFLYWPNYERLSKSVIYWSDYSSLLDAIKVCVLDLDIYEYGFECALGDVFRGNRSLHYSLRYRFDCQSLLAWTLMSIWPHERHQKYIEMLHGTAKEEQHAEICQHFPFDRSLKDLARVAVLSTLCLPRSVSAKKLPIPRSLQEYLCLQ